MAAPGTLSSPSPGAAAANQRVRSNSRTPDRGRTPDRNRAASSGAFSVIALSPTMTSGVEIAKKRRAASHAPTSPSGPPPATSRTEASGAARHETADNTAVLSATVLKLQQMVDDMGRDKIRFEADLLKRLDEYKDFAIKSAKILVDASCRDIVSGIEAEIVMPERFKAHLVGRSEPIFAALFDDLYVPKVAIVDQKI